MTKRANLATIGDIDTSVNSLNENFQALNEKLDNTVSRDGSTPNAMEADFDMNSHDILNANTVYSRNLLVNGVDIFNQISSVTGQGVVVEGYDTGTITDADTYAITRDVVTENLVDVYIDGIAQRPNVDYQIVTMASSVSGKGIKLLGMKPEGSTYLFRWKTPSQTSSATDGDAILLSGGLSVQESFDALEESLTDYASRSDFVAAVAGGLSLPNGTTRFAEGFMYEALSGATAISDLPGWIPAGDITPQHFGAVADGNIDSFTIIDNATDNTDAFAEMFAYSPVGSSLQETHYRIPQGIYCVRNITIQNKVRFAITAENAVLYGISQSYSDQFIHFHNVHRFRQFGYLRLATDGNRTSPLYHGNYGCAIRFTSNTDAGSSSPFPVYSVPTSDHVWQGVEISQFESGIVAGNLVGDPDHHREGQDSIFMCGMYFRSVMKPVYQNMENSGLQFIAPEMYVQQFSASSSWWDNSDSWFMRSDNGRILVHGGVAQKANSSGYAFYGTDINLNGISYESSAENYVTGSWNIIGLDRGFCDGQVNPVFNIASGTTGELRISDSEFRRITRANIDANLAPGTDCLFIDSKNAPDMRISLKGVKCWEFYFEPIAGSTKRHFVRGGRLTMSDVTITNTSAFKDYYFPADSVLNVTDVDTEGNSMSTTSDLSAKGGWTAYGLTGGNFEKITTGVPTPHTAAIAIESVGTTGGIAGNSGTSGFRVRSLNDYYMNALYDRISGTGYPRVLIEFFDFAGTSLGSATEVWGRQDSEHADDNLTGGWNTVNIPFKAPAGAHYARIYLQATNVAVRFAFTGLNS